MCIFESLDLLLSKVFIQSSLPIYMKLRLVYIGLSLENTHKQQLVQNISVCFLKEEVADNILSRQLQGHHASSSDMSSLTILKESLLHSTSDKNMQLGLCVKTSIQWNGLPNGIHLIVLGKQQVKTWYIMVTNQDSCKVFLTLLQQSLSKSHGSKVTAKVIK